MFICAKCRYIVSDCDSVGVLYEQQHYTATPEDAAAATIKAGNISFISSNLKFHNFVHLVFNSILRAG